MLVGPKYITEVPLSAYQDGITRIPGLTPASAPPNDYTTSGDASTGGCNWFSTVAFQTPASLPFVDVWAVPWTASTTPQTVGYFLDGAFVATLAFGSVVGVKAVQRITLPVDGNAHLVVLEEQASLVNIVSPAAPVVYQAAVAPANRLIVMGDSNAAAAPGAAASFPSKSYGDQVRHGMPNGWRTTVWGVPGRAMFGSQNSGSQVIARCDGTAKNVVLISLQINDAVGGVSQANNLAAQNQLVAAILAGAPANTQVGLVSSPQTQNAGYTASLAQFRANMAAAAAANPTKVKYLDNSALWPQASPFATYMSADAVHYVDAGEDLFASNLLAWVLANF